MTGWEANVMAEKVLLTIDGLVNLALGIILLLFPVGVGAALGLPPFADAFYPTLLGGVLVGIGLALFIQHSRGSLQISGLGIGGAIVINMCGAGVLVMWLAFGKLNVPSTGQNLLWVVAIAVFLIAAVEILWWFWKRRTGETGR
jgi:LPXTG-motif cell wall-anchored protein